MILRQCTKNYVYMKFGYRVVTLANRRVILGQYFPFYAPCRSKNQNLKRNNVPKDIVMLHMCT